MTIKTSKFDMSDYLDTPEMIKEYICAAIEDSEEDLLLSALGDVVKARGATAMAKKTGINRPNLYRALSKTGNPRISTVKTVLNELGLKLTIEAA